MFLEISFLRPERASFLCLMTVAIALLMNGCRNVPIQNQKVKEFVEQSIMQSEAYSAIRQKALNKGMSSLVPVMREDFGKRLGRNLTDGEQAKLANIARETLGELVDELISEWLQNYFPRYFEPDELDEIQKFYETPTGKKVLEVEAYIMRSFEPDELEEIGKFYATPSGEKMLRAAFKMDVQNAMRENVSMESMEQKIILGFAKKLEKDDHALYSALFPSPPNYIGRKEDPCPPAVRSLMGRCFELTKPIEILP